MLSSLLFLAGYVLYGSMTSGAWLIAAGMALISGYGQFYNQLRDYEVDRAAGLHNTASLVGPRFTRWLMIACLGLAGICLLINSDQRVVALVAGRRGSADLPDHTGHCYPDTDLRGSAVVDRSGRAQLGFLIVSNALLVAWLIVNWIGY